ncbi:alpha-D-ribose 1-methylphosphonate 5-phosphate C-P lyase [Desulfuromusa kysingii]|uniref:Alpha-D-ribose 1-methylphosphonate 5-phosphate C-P lyase n=1 Tax=Desulfuromusa kysingii TaxID=37625 RepID=A0A1H3ZWM1_9BACT|nr:alpha-D-ribose 1-methylphosphonate 5-phosphate C-P-lyase PhnJ [Desulfuromusa kysingii]SEA28089.1 alpha-D-ribose 1-methylphosphonate 5-phosphate C-P lyase [Desulfuromusa kysingii]
MNLQAWRTQHQSESLHGYNFAFLDDSAKKEIRRSLLKAVAIPGYQVPFSSQEMPVARGWGTGGLQITLSLILPEDILKVIDQGCDDSVNAVNIKKFVAKVAEVNSTTDTQAATLIQTRHRIPEEPMSEGQILVLQVPYPEALREVEPSELETRRMHAEGDYARMWLYLYEDIVRYGEISISYRYPVTVNDHYIMDPSPIPRWDVPKLHMSEHLSLFGAGREKRIYAIPPYTRVEPLEFEDHKFRIEQFPVACSRCGSCNSYLDEIISDVDGSRQYFCSDTDYCDKRCA